MDINCSCGSERVVLDHDGEWVIENDGEYAGRCRFCPDCGRELMGLTLAERNAAAAIGNLARAIYWSRFKERAELRAKILREAGFE